MVQAEIFDLLWIIKNDEKKKYQTNLTHPGAQIFEPLILNNF